jgi:hypothetical protein
MWAAADAGHPPHQTVEPGAHISYFRHPFCLNNLLRTEMPLMSHSMIIQWTRILREMPFPGSPIVVRCGGLKEQG